MTSRMIRRVGVVGAGTMGHGIAHVAALAGMDVILTDIEIEAATAGLDKVKKNLDKGVKRGKVSAEAAEAALNRIDVGKGPGAAADGTDLIVEAVPEKLELKRAIFKAVEEVASPTAILGSNTSSLSLTEIQAGLRRPEHVVGLHFFNPVHIMKLLEIVKGKQTSSETIEAAQAFGIAIGKEPIVVQDSPGFATSRLGIALGNEAMRMLEEGVASAEDIDKAMTLGYRHPMGPLRLSDLVGLDVRLAISEYLFERLGSDTFRPPNILRERVAAGKLGQKVGEGFYSYE